MIGKSTFKPDKFVSVIIPTLNEEEHVDNILETFDFEPTKKQLIIVDGNSLDKTVDRVKKFKRGSREYLNLKIIKADKSGKGYQMIKGYEASLGQTIVFLDADLDADYSKLVKKLSQPILKGKAFFVKSKFDRGDEWGRVTKLTAQPLLEMFYPELNFIEQPLSGQVAYKKQLVSQLLFPENYGVEISHLIQYYKMYGLSNIEQVDLGNLQHRHRGLGDLQLTSQQILKTVLYHAREDGKLDIKDSLLWKLPSSLDFL
jgi:glucosyl-3-phosphoglycerate synthase